MDNRPWLDRNMENVCNKNFNKRFFSQDRDQTFYFNYKYTLNYSRRTHYK